MSQQGNFEIFWGKVDLVAFDIDIVRFGIFEPLQTLKAIHELLQERSAYKALVHYKIFNIPSTPRNVYRMT